MAPTVNPIVSVAHCAGYHPLLVRQAMQRCLQSLGGMSHWVKPGWQVLIKPNLILPKPPSVPAQTHPEIICAVAEHVLACGATAVVSDSPAWGTVQECLERLGIYEKLVQMGVKILPMNDPMKVKIGKRGVWLSRLALTCDAIINVPKFKTHQQLTATFTVKNMFGCVVGKQKAYWHFAQGHSYSAFCKLLWGIYDRLKPVLNIIDGVVAMEGQGPISGQPKQLGLIIAGQDPVACEQVCCQAIGMDYWTLPILQTAERNGHPLFEENQIQIVGDGVVLPVCRDFVPANLIPLRFGFVRICKSIAKQGYLLTKNALARLGR